MPAKYAYFHKPCVILFFMFFLLAISQSEVTAYTNETLMKFCGRNWYGLYMQDHKVGYLSSEIAKLTGADGSWKTSDLVTIKSQFEGSEFSMSLEDTRFYDGLDHAIDSNYLKIQSPAGNIEVVGMRAGKSSYNLTTRIAGAETINQLDYIPDFLDSVLFVVDQITNANLVIGDSFSVLYFEPTPPLQKSVHHKLSMQNIEKNMLNGVESKIYTVNIYYPEYDMAVQTKYNGDGLLLDGQFGAEMTCRIEPEQKAKEITEPFNIYDISLVKTNAKIAEPQKLRSIDILISGVNPRDLPEMGNQKIIEKSAESALIEIGRRPEVGYAAEISDIRKSHMRYLAPDLLIQSDDPKIIALANSIVGQIKNGYEAATKINQWVYRNISKQFSPELSNALTTFKSRKGDCGEHAVLAIALMRAAGIPAREVSGLIYWPPGDSFGYHAWIEVYVGEWIQLDPSWGEDNPNPSHIALAIGDLPGRQGVLSRLLGKIKIEIVSTEYLP